MSKLAYVMMTLVGAIPAGGANYFIVRHFLDFGFSEPPIVVGAFGATWLMTFLVALTPLVVLIKHKSPEKPAKPDVAAKSDDASADEKPAKGKKGKEKEGFDDAIPEDFDENELADDGFSEDEAFEDIDEDFDEDFEEEEEEKPKKKKKK